jgi:hypothetical protein
MAQYAKADVRVRLPVQNPTKQTTHIDVYVDHNKGCKRVDLNVYPVHVKDGWVTVRIMPGCGYRILEEMPRLNRKRLNQLGEAAVVQVKNKSGLAWDMVKNCCVAEGVELQEETPDAAI